MVQLGRSGGHKPDQYERPRGGDHSQHRFRTRTGANFKERSSDRRQRIRGIGIEPRAVWIPQGRADGREDNFDSAGCSADVLPRLDRGASILTDDSRQLSPPHQRAVTDQIATEAAAASPVAARSAERCQSPVTSLLRGEVEQGARLAGVSDDGCTSSLQGVRLCRRQAVGASLQPIGDVQGTGVPEQDHVGDPPS
jgi:hypothetical protein